MLIALLLIVLGIVLFDTRTRIKSLEERIAALEMGLSGDVAQPLPEADRTTAKTIPAVVVLQRRPSLENIAITATEAEAPVATPTLEPFRPDPISEELVAAPAFPRPRGFAFEDLFGRRLPIWAGGITLAVAGVLLVKYSIDSGLLSPVVRVILGLLFGGGLIAGAEIALRQEERLRDVRVRQSLAGAGLATLYAVILTADNLYHLIGPGIAFVGLAGVTGMAMGLSLRFGAPSALLGLVGGLAAPALAGSNEPNVPLLSCYLALIIGGLSALSRTQRWMWLGVSALIGGAGWGSWLIFTGALDLASSFSVGLLVLAIGIGFPLLAFSGSRATLLRAVYAMVASAQMAALVATGGFAPLHWALFGLLSLAFLWLSGREPVLRRVVPVGLAVALLLAGVWPTPPALAFTLVVLGIVAIYGGAALWRLWRPGGSLLEAGQIAAVTLGCLFVDALHFYRATSTDDVRFALIALAAAAIPVLALALGWRNATRKQDARFVTLATSAALLLVTAGTFGLVGWMLPVIVALVAAGMLLLAERADDSRVEWNGWVFGFASLALLIAGDRGVAEGARLFGHGAGDAPLPAFLRWTTVAVAAALYAWRARFAEGRVVAQVVAALAAYGAIAQWAPVHWLAPLAALALPALVEGARRLPPQRLLPALGAMLMVVLLWSALPLFNWGWHALLSLAAVPMLATVLPHPAAMFRLLAFPAALIALALWRGKAVIAGVGYRIGVAIGALWSAVAVHIFYKQLFNIADGGGFVRIGLTERTIWEAVLLAAGWALWRVAGHRRAALAFIAVALAHNAFYTLLLHNPLWTSQAMGSVPLVSLLVPAFAVPFAALWLACRIAPDLAIRFARPVDAAHMGLIVLFAFAALRQLSEGSILNAPHLGAGEDIGRSVLAIMLAIGFLLWGIRKGARDWRIASLVLMICAVGKVFLLDASGLTGLLRIASFLALGFSLIGIGWLYSRQLRTDMD